ncbi:enoyl-CoA hydratase-related protein [Nocardia arizonensis]|uniref:enoyl-CoA hydratase-related protein n=1 Tax=Nocardia arizonensis TaxID=1141647 RepID=UPI0006D09905|nr:enoyl-CoA hydratase-related protein [Nocardia arizonensis]
MSAQAVDGLEITRDSAVLTLTIDNPDRLNAMSYTVMAAITEVLDGIDGAGADRVVVITGRGKAFCTGADLSAGRTINGRAIGTDEVMRTAAGLIRAVSRTPVPVVSKLNGPTAGIGVSLALASDLVYMAESSYLLMAFINIGLMPDGGSSALIAAAAGRARAAEMALLGERLPATEAAACGLVTAAVPDTDLDARVAEVVAKLARGPRRALALTKQAINSAAIGRLDEALELETVGQLELLESVDFAEGADAMRNRRPAKFA